MSIFRRPDYESEITQFIASMKHDRPQLEAQQRQGRELLWDKTVDREEWQEFRAGGVPQQPYVYQTGHS